MLNVRHLYSLLLWLALPYALFHLLWRARKQPEYLQHIGERFGFYARHGDKPVIWLHTVSVGETRAAAKLVQRLLDLHPEHQILLTHTTPTGRAASEQLYGDRVQRVYLPYDYSFAVKRFLRHFRPQVGVLLETEIWFNLIHHCHSARVPLLLLNARLSEKSAARYAGYPRLTRPALRDLAGIAAQTQADADRLTALGAPQVSVMGNLKYDIEAPGDMLERGLTMRCNMGINRPVFLAASTREGEEDLLLSALQSLNIPHLLIVLVPRHPQRFDEVAALCARHQLTLQRRSDEQPVAPETQVWLGDSMGEMFAYYMACDIAFIGGSLLPFGGQNLIEACSMGKPVLIGPHTYNFAEASRMAVETGAALRIESATELGDKLQELFRQPGRMTRMGRAGMEFVRANRGATETAVTLIGNYQASFP
ncbi:MAG TPA: lipid IV(A) 3-deoxy-D-manno-octulosonic acid transferase [Gallionellaceae bacterium]